ncbi:MAG: enoyl-CoA hydratase-related protein [Arenimonas sp.]
MTTRNLLVEDRESIRTITLNRPDKLNALNRETIRELREAFEAAGDDESVRVVVLTGAGPKAFVAGADIVEMNGLSPAQARDFSRAGQRLMTCIERLGKPVIAKVNGFALGGGLELALACHLRIAADSAKFGQPEINLGLIPGFGGTQRLLRLCGRGPTLEMCLLGEPIDSARALQLNLVTRVVANAELDAETLKLATKLATSAPQALRGILDAVLVAGEAALDTGLELETQAFALAFSTQDMREGTGAFLARRAPTFTGR